MPLTRNNISESSQELIRWRYSELAKVLYFLDDNFDKWYNDNYNLCVKAKEVTDIIWDAESIYNKVHSLFKIMGDYLQTGIKSSECTIIWENEEIYKLVKRIYFKTKKRLKEDNQEVASGQKSNGRIEKILNSDQITIEARMDRPCSIEAIFNLCDEKIQKITNSAEELKEKARADCEERFNQISQYRSKLIKKINETSKLINETNKMYEEFRKF